jgi:hypothetical protein
MRTIDPDRVSALRAECTQRVTILDAARARELRKPLDHRQPSFLAFLDKERSVYAFAADLLDRLQSEEGSDHRAMVGLSASSHGRGQST